ncbi:uncharacterized protein LOC125660234 [Ostrea edulis]|uniref:uncharacterized protein LOC125660234 n=1 Tax=Ostrea edulis TaxID=37623 RepID=UPI0024AF8412|nr:uncharacterized protein LOC125660234 [Ostrea edulis]
MSLKMMRLVVAFGLFLACHSFTLPWHLPELFKHRPEWDALRVRWGLNLFNENNFRGLPRRESDAHDARYVLLSDECRATETPHPSTPTSAPPATETPHPSTPTAALPATETPHPSTTSNTPYPITEDHGISVNSSQRKLKRPLHYPYVEDGDFIFFTVYFIEPERICSREHARFVDDFEHWGTGSGLFIQNGTDAGSYIQIPRDEVELRHEHWKAEKCFWTLGRIFSYNFHDDQDCQSQFPLLLNYNHGRLTGFSLLWKLDFSSCNLEHPDKGLLRFMFEKVPKCYYEMGRLTKLQFFFTNDYLSHQYFLETEECLRTLKTMQKLILAVLICIGEVSSLPLNTSLEAGIRRQNFQLPQNFVWNTWEVFQKNGNWHPGLMDEWDGTDQDSPIADLLQTMVFYDSHGIPHKTKTVIHELMHAIGQMHEQQRSDRDQYIDILYQNIPQSGRNNFDISNTFDRTPYDVESIMQYPLTSFSQTGSKTMVLKDARLEALIDTAKTFTHSDIEEITLAYECAAGCQNPPSCKNEGFVAHTCQCLCPPDLSGATCEQVKSDSDCGGVINLSSGQMQVIESPGYPNAVASDKECVWLIRGPSGSNIKLGIEELNIARNDLNAQCHHWIEIRYNRVSQTGIRQCNKKTNETYRTTNDGERNLLLVKFDSRFRKDIQSSPGQMFKFKVEVEGGSSSNPCDPNPCLNSGSCNVVGSTFDCACAAGWTGTICDVPVLSCQPNPCQNGGTCQIIGNSVSCDCPPGWQGLNCETSSVTTTTTTTTSSPPGNTMLCDFESNSCWMDLYGNIFIRTASVNVEPHSAFGGTTRYAYVLPGSSFSLWSPSGALSNMEYCISFGFYISGFSPSLGVYHRNNFQQNEYLWHFNQNTYGYWYSVQIPFYGTTSDLLTIYGSIGSGVLAIDEVRLINGMCPSNGK